MINDEIDLLITNGKIVTMNNKEPVVEAVAVNNGKIIAVGKTRLLLDDFPKSKKVIDLKGKFLCSAFNDTHTHLIAMSAKFQDVDLAEVKSPEEALEKIAERVKTTPKGKWIFAERWDESNWTDKRYLTLDELDKIASNNPCFARRVCGHLVAVNSLALQELGVNWDDSDLDLDQTTKKPIGIITDALIDRLADSPKLKKSQEEYNEAVKLACSFAHSLGVTSVTDNLSLKGFKAYLNAWKKEKLSIRIYVNIPRLSFDNYLETGLLTGYGDSILRIGGVKIFTDGSLGARTAALKEPYFDDSKVKGGFYIDKDEFNETIEIAVNNNWQTATHAIGDEAIDWILEAFERLDDISQVQAGRHRIEHAEYLHKDQLDRVNKLGLILSMQPNFPGRWGKQGQLYETRLGPERYKLLNNFRMIIDSKAKLCFGSDNMPMSPIFGIWSVAAHPIENIKITVEEALYHFTLGAAFSSFEEDIKGSIEVGKVADFVVLDKDILSINPEEIKDTNVLMTFFNGKIVYEKTA